jgi:hypothetical protein
MKSLTQKRNPHTHQKPRRDHRPSKPETEEFRGDIRVGQDKSQSIYHLEAEES